MNKTFPVEVTDDGWVTVSTPALDRDKDRIMPLGIELGNYEKNPILLWGHNYGRPEYVIGRAAEMRLDQGGFHLVPEWREPVNESDPMHVIRALWDGKFIKAFSIGFNPKEWEENDDGGRDYTRTEILEVSLVTVPANQEALRLALKGVESPPTIPDFPEPGVWQAFLEGLKKELGFAEAEQVPIEQIYEAFDVIEKGVVRYNAYPPADEGMSWSGSGARKRLKEWAGESMSKYSRGFAYIDGDPDNYGSYKFPHHDVVDGSVKTVWRGVRAAMGSAVFGARGGRISNDSDRRKVFSHLAKHYRQFDKDVPEYKVYSEDEWRKVFGEEDDTEEIIDEEPGIADDNELTPEQEVQFLEALNSFLDILTGDNNG